MTAMFAVLTIMIGTAVLAALIVAADWDLAFIRGWSSLTNPNVRSPHASPWSPALNDAPVSVRPWPGGFADRVAEPAGVERIAVSNTNKTEADEWLAAAAAHRLPEWSRAELQQTDSGTPSQPATTLRDVLAARRAEALADAA